MKLGALGVVVAWTAVATPAAAQRWQDATTRCLGTTAEWSNKVALADVDGDGQVDLLIANGGNYATPGPAEATRVWKNLGTWAPAGTACTEISAQAVGGFTGQSRVIEAADLDGDRDLDLVTGGAYQTQLKLFTRGAGGWTDGTAQLPQQATSVGDVAIGDVDGDGDLDLLLAEWGATNPNEASYPGGRTRLYLNNGQGTFTDATATNMPDVLVKWSWDVELADVDGDWDLDALVACKLCATNFLFRNDGTGHFTSDTTALPALTNNYDFEPMDLDRDGDLDLVTVNSGPQLREQILINDGTGHFIDETSTRLAGTANPANADDNVAIWLDVDADGDADLLIGSLGADRLLINNSGDFLLDANATPNDTPATLGIAAADLDGDGRLDLLQGQGESAFPDKVQLATTSVAVDTVPPTVTVERITEAAPPVHIRARVLDHVSPARPHDLQRVWIEHDGFQGQLLESGPPPYQPVDMTWMGEYLWTTPALTHVYGYRVCATDRRNNTGCSDWVYVPVGGLDGLGGDAGGPGLQVHLGGCCDAQGSPGSAVPISVLVLLVWRRRRNAA